MRKILFVSSLYTGFGHRSITEAIREQMAKLDPEVRIIEIDGFELGGRMSAAMSRVYDWIVTHTPVFWKIYYQLGNVFPAIARFYTTASISGAFRRMIRETDPDLVAVVHPVFVGPVETLLAGMGSGIPVVSLIADLDNVSRLWADKRSAYTLCPTENARRTMLRYGISYERTKVFGFPVRDRFKPMEYQADEAGGSEPDKMTASTTNAMAGSKPVEMTKRTSGSASTSVPDDVAGSAPVVASAPMPAAATSAASDSAASVRPQMKKRLNFLIMNGSQGRGRVLKMAEILLDHFDCNVVVLAGNNPRWKAAVGSKLRRFGDRITVCGFVTDVERYMCAADILLLRASPNVMMEAVTLCRPFIVTGALNGQEEKNPAFAETNHLGVVCKRVSELPAIVRRLLDRDANQLRQIEAHQREYRTADAAHDMAEFLLLMLQEPVKGGNS